VIVNVGNNALSNQESLEASIVSLGLTISSDKRKNYRWSSISLVLIGFSIYVLTCTAWIESVNVLAGHPLPLRDSDSSWRIAAAKFDDSTMTSQVRRQRVWERFLRDLVGTVGVVQFPAATIAILLGAGGVVSRPKRHHIVGWLLVWAGILALTSGIYRQYWSALD
jgi:hypothetical protein